MVLYAPDVTAFCLENPHAAIVYMTKTYDPRNSQPWSDNRDLPVMCGQHRDLFYRNGDAVYYAGTYHALADLPITLDDCLRFGEEQGHHVGRIFLEILCGADALTVIYKRTKEIVRRP